MKNTIANITKEEILMEEVIVKSLKYAADSLDNLYERKCADPEIKAAENAFALTAIIVEQIKPGYFDDDPYKLGTYIVEQVFNGYRGVIHDYSGKPYKTPKGMLYMNEMIAEALIVAADSVGDIYERKFANPAFKASEKAFRMVAEIINQMEPDDYGSDYFELGDHLAELALNDYPDFDF